MRKFVVRLLILLIILTVGILIGKTYVQNYIEDTLNGEPNVSVSSVEVNLSSQKIEIEDLSMKNNVTTIEVSHGSIKLSLKELLDLIFLQNRELYTIDIDITKGLYINEANSLNIKDAQIHIEGIFPLSDMNSSIVRRVDATIEEFALQKNSSMVSQFTFGMGSILMKGTLTETLLRGSMSDLISSLSKISIELDKGQLILNENENEMLLRLVNNGNIVGEKVSLLAFIEGQDITIDSIELISPLITFNGKVDITSSPTLSYDLMLDIESLDDNVRGQLSLPLMFMGYYIPEGPFTLLANQVVGEGPLDFSITEKE